MQCLHVSTVDFDDFRKVHAGYEARKSLLADCHVRRLVQLSMNCSIWQTRVSKSVNSHIVNDSYLWRADID